MNNRKRIAIFLTLLGLAETLYISFFQCSLLSLDIYPSHQCGNNSIWFLIPAILFIFVGILIYRTKPWYEKLEVEVKYNENLLVLTRKIGDTKLTAFEFENTITLTLDSSNNIFADALFMELKRELPNQIKNTISEFEVELQKDNDSIKTLTKVFEIFNRLQR